MIYQTTITCEGWRLRNNFTTKNFVSNSIVFEEKEIHDRLLQLDKLTHIVQLDGRIGACHDEELLLHDKRQTGQDSLRLLATIPAISPVQLGDSSFQTDYGVKFNYYTGAMANGIASEELIISLGKKKILGSFGSGGLLKSRLEEAITKIQKALPKGPYLFNLIHSPFEEELERNAVDLYLQYGVRSIEASAFMNLTSHIVRYRVAGLEMGADKSIIIRNRIIAKVSREYVAEKFLSPPPPDIVSKLLKSGEITPLQAKLAELVPMADDITVEADSGGHTDNRPLISLLPTIITLRDKFQAKYRYLQEVRIGAAGGIATPMSALGAFMMGAAYIGTGSVNQSCIEAAISPDVKQALSKCSVTDVTMAPASDMFEMGVQVQVLKQGTLFPARAQKLYYLYRNYNSIDAIPHAEREKLEKQIFRKSLDSIWKECVTFFQERDPEQLIRAKNDEKRKMALVFRWYLGLSSHWAISGNQERKTDYQIWCGPAIGAFNEWVRGSTMENVNERYVAEVAQEIMWGASYLYRVEQLRISGVRLPIICRAYRPGSILSVLE
ncbi:2-nitropropane dioxygenase [Bacillus atrophaeus]|nr:2-nitropropane dioxygenase [Bacillus atrophaeus]